MEVSTASRVFTKLLFANSLFRFASTPVASSHHGQSTVGALRGQSLDSPGQVGAQIQNLPIIEGDRHAPPSPLIIRDQVHHALDGVGLKTGFDVVRRCPLRAPVLAGDEYDDRLFALADTSSCSPMTSNISSTTSSSPKHSESAAVSPAE